MGSDSFSLLPPSGTFGYMEKCFNCINHVCSFYKLDASTSAPLKMPEVPCSGHPDDMLEFLCLDLLPPSAPLTLIFGRILPPKAHFLKANQLIGSSRAHYHLLGLSHSRPLSLCLNYPRTWHRTTTDSHYAPKLTAIIQTSQFCLTCFFTWKSQ